ncbi:UNVERIFIED_CONTAM: hypothetical protein FKN15_030659 [Acipenser sinensis]
MLNTHSIYWEKFLRRERETETEKDVVLDPEELEDEHDQEENQNAKVDEPEYVLNPEAEEFQFFDPIDETGRWDDDLAEEVIASNCDYEDEERIPAPRRSTRNRRPPDRWEYPLVGKQAQAQVHEFKCCQENNTNEKYLFSFITRQSNNSESESDVK